MKMSETKVTTDGVFRCCLTFFNETDFLSEVKIGDTANCKYCKQSFILTDYRNQPFWLPDWQVANLQKSDKKCCCPIIVDDYCAVCGKYSSLDK